MKFKIKHQNKVLQIIGIVFTCLTFVFIVIGTINVSMFWAMIATLALTVLTAILCFIDMGVGASIKISGDTITVTGLFLRKKIDAKDIASVFMEDIVRYRRKPDIHYEYRKKMTIILNSGKSTVLTDNASEVNGIIGFITGERDRKRDDDIPLFQAYEEILKLRN